MNYMAGNDYKSAIISVLDESEDEIFKPLKFRGFLSIR